MEHLIHFKYYTVEEFIEENNTYCLKTKPKSAVRTYIQSFIINVYKDCMDIIWVYNNELCRIILPYIKYEFIDIQFTYDKINYIEIITKDSTLLKLQSSRITEYPYLFKELEMIDTKWDTWNNKSMEEIISKYIAGTKRRSLGKFVKILCSFYRKNYGEPSSKIYFNLDRIPKECEDQYKRDITRLRTSKEWKFYNFIIDNYKIPEILNTLPWIQWISRCSIEVIKYNTIDNKSEFPNVYRVEIPLVSNVNMDEFKASSRSLYKFIRYYLVCSKSIDKDILKLLKIDKAVKTSDNTFIMIMSYKMDDVCEI